jgi:galactose oxidase-like protein
LAESLRQSVAFFLHRTARMLRKLVPILFLVGCVADVTETEEPENRPPVVELGDLAVGEGQTKAFELVTSDPDGDAVEISLVTALEAQALESSLELHAPYGVVGPQDVIVSARDARGAITEETRVVDVKPLAWRSATTWGAEGPEAREHGAMIVDADARYALLVGGSGYAPYGEALGDVWRFDLDTKAWSSVMPSGDVPPPAGSRRVASVPGTTTAYLFGGYGEGNEVSNDLYRLDHANGEAAFELVSQMNPPPARALHAFFYDPATERFYAMGGFGQGVLDDLWSMQLVDGVAQWTQLDLPVRPSPRYGFFYGFDAEQQRLILYSGAQGTAAVNPATDTWALDVKSEPPVWTALMVNSPPGRRNGCMVFDPTGPRLWVFGGTPDAMTTAPGLWVFDARAGKETWTEKPMMGEPPLRSSGFGIFDATTEQALLGFGNSSTGVYQDLNAIGY